MKAEKVYQYLPVPLQNLACSLYGLRQRHRRMGGLFWDRYEWLQQTENWFRDDINDYQDAGIANLVRHAYKTVPYYRRIMGERGLTPTDVTSRTDLQRLPVLRKEDVLRYHDELHSSSFSRRGLINRKTSGTTGTALSFPTTRNAISFQWAVWWRHRKRFNVEPNTWHLNFTGKPVVPPEQEREPYWRWNLPMRQAVTSMQHVTAGKVESLIRFIDSHEFKFFSGYPSIIHPFCDLLHAQEARLNNPPEFVFLGAENVQKHQVASIRRATDAIVSDQYGFAEGCGNASPCAQGSYHEDWEFGVLECVDAELVEDDGVRGRVLATGFSNYAFPFIRYDIGDVAVWAPDGYRCECGRASRVIRRIEGRSEDYVLTPEGTRIRRFDYVFKETRGVREAQVVQRERGGIVIRLVARETFSSEDRRKIRQKVHDWISPRLDVEFEMIDRIPRTLSGKFRPVVSELDRSVDESLSA